MFEVPPSYSAEPGWNRGSSPSLLGSGAFLFRGGGRVVDRIKVTLPDGSVREYAKGISLAKIARDAGKGEAFVATVNGALRDLHASLEGDARVEFLSFEHPQGRSVYWHSSTHLMAQAVKELFPGVKLAIGPPIDDGFYYDFDIGRPFTPEDLAHIEAKMRELAARDQPIERVEIPRDEAIRLFSEQGEKYKLELIQDIPDARVSFYRQNGFADMCRGPHLPRTGLIKSIKLLSTSGAYWRGDERREMLQRIYGVTFPQQGQLDEFLHRLEEAKRRDHRRLGRELELYTFLDEIGPGLAIWLPKGARMRMIMEEFVRGELLKRGYEFVYTPHVARERLWEVSGHLTWFRENMFSGMDVEGQQYLVKPMNCPFHIMAYASKTRSYRDLPLKLAEFGTVYRYERSGTLHGMTRLRGQTTEDAHIFCRPDQVKVEVSELLDLAFLFLQAFGFREYLVALSLHDPARREEYAGREDEWHQAEQALEEVLQSRGLPYERMVGEAAFYGPKIDVHVRDALDRPWQLTTIQFDFNLPGRFRLTYMGEDGVEHPPIMIHRALLGSFERFMGVLVEHYGGAFPVWLAPVQVRVLPIADRHAVYAQEVHRRLVDAGLRAEVDESKERISHKVRQGQIEHIPYMLVVGDKEAGSGQAAVRSRAAGDLGPMPLEQFVDRIRQEIAAKA